jgi:ribosomal protein L37E
MNGTNGLQIIGPPRRPNTAYRIARERAAEQQRAQPDTIVSTSTTHTRADTNTACPSCGSGIFDAAYGYCPSCGYERTNNGHAVHQRSAAQTTPTQKCGICGIPWDQCLHGYHAHGRT